MKKNILLIAVLFFMQQALMAQGVAVVKIDSVHQTFTALNLAQNVTNVQIDNQVATVITSQLFVNNTGDTTNFKYAFPLPETAAATNIRWFYHGYWHNAVLIGAPQDTTFQTDSTTTSPYIPAALDTFLGGSPLYFPVNLFLAPGDTVSIELTYVQLLPYQNSYVSFDYPGKYNLIQPGVNLDSLHVSINSYRLIDSLNEFTYAGWINAINGNEATADISLHNSTLNDDFKLQYLLHPDSTGFFSFSTYYPDSLLRCDTLNGFFTFIVEPNSTIQTDIIPKDFVLIIDHSGSMEGVKIDQAKDAATYIVNNLNSGDRFNIIQFDATVESMSPVFLDYNIANQNAALSYISSIAANSSTDISDALDLGINMFAASDSTRAKIIVFLTDGQPNVGISDPTALVAHETSLRESVAPGLSLNAFGVGSDVNYQLLSQLAADNNGIAVFFDNSDLASVVSNFYTTIQSPVLLNTSINYSPPVVAETYPQPVPSLYKGQQLVITGRYKVPGPDTVTLTGTAFGFPVSYQYVMNLTDSLIGANSFLTKLWAKDDIDYLMNEYYINQGNSQVTDSLTREIQSLSFCWGVVSPLTSFSGTNPGGGAGGGGDLVGIEEKASSKDDLSLVIYPNPASKNAQVILSGANMEKGRSYVKIISADGKVLATLEYIVDSVGITLNMADLKLDSGMYLVEVKTPTKNYIAKLIIEE